MIEKIKYYISHNRILLSAASAVGLFFLARPNIVSLALGTLLLLGGESIRTWSSGHINKNKSLANTGPYSYTRNPLYVGNFLLALGFAVMSFNLSVLIAVIGAFILIYSPTIKREEQKLTRLFGDDYVDYQNKVPRFFPRLTPAYKNSEKNFDWQLVKKHREFNTWAGIVFGISLFILKTILPLSR